MVLLLVLKYFTSFNTTTIDKLFFFNYNSNKEHVPDGNKQLGHLYYSVKY